MKRTVCVILTLIVLLNAFSASVFAKETENEKLDRVYAEVLCGNITNIEDVLDVAVEQMEMMEGSDAATYASRAASDDSSLQITQLVDSSKDEAGNIEATVAVTGLLLLDENGRSVSADEYREYRMNKTNQEGDLSEYQIYATHTIYVKVRDHSPNMGGTSSLELDHMKVTLIYGSSISATKLRQRYFEQSDYVDLDTVLDEQAWIYNPSAGTYRYDPPNASEVRLGFTAVQGTAEIYCGSDMMTIGTVLPTDFLQDKIDNGILAEGW